MDTSDFARRLADKLIAQLKDGTSPWQKPWKDGLAFSPYNPTTGNRYRGVNIVALMAMDFSDPRWMTYKQAQGQGWQVRGAQAELASNGHVYCLTPGRQKRLMKDRRLEISLFEDPDSVALEN